MSLVPLADIFNHKVATYYVGAGAIRSPVSFAEGRVLKLTILALVISCGCRLLMLLLIKRSPSTCGLCSLHYLKSVVTCCGDSFCSERDSLTFSSKKSSQVRLGAMDVLVGATFQVVSTSMLRVWRQCAFESGR